MLPELRRSGLMIPLYVLREHWSVGHGYTSAEFTIRADNMRTRTMQEARGAVVMEVKDTRFADGSVAPTCFYTRPLRQAQMESTLKYLSETLELLGPSPSATAHPGIQNG